MREICPKYTRVCWYYDAENMRVVVFRLRCGQWKCPVCAVVNRRLWREFLNKRLPKIAPQWWLMTLTARADTRGRIESYKQLRRGIDVLMKRFRRAFGSVQYVRVYEKHPSSEALHAHFIITGLADYVQVQQARNGRVCYRCTNFRRGKLGFWALRTFVKKTAQASNMGYIADIKALSHSGKAVRYITKYLTKDGQDIDIKHIRHVQTTRAVGSPKHTAKNALYVGYRLNKSDLVAGMAVYDADKRRAVPDEYWHDGNVYPPLHDGA